MPTSLAVSRPYSAPDLARHIADHSLEWILLFGGSSSSANELQKRVVQACKSRLLL